MFEKFKKSKNFQNKIGYISGFLSILFYAIINVIANAPSRKDYNIFLYAIIFVIIKEFFAIISYFFIKGNFIEKFKDIKRAFQNQSKKSIWAAIAGLLGGIIGFSLTTAGGLYIGAGLASPFYSIEIFALTLIMFVFLKRRPSHFQIAGVILIFISILSISIFSALRANESVSADIIIGICLLVFGVFCWTAESLIFDIITIDKKVNVNTLVNIKQLSSFVFGFILVMPIFSILATHNFSDVYIQLGYSFSKDYMVGLLAGISGILLYLGRYLFFYSTMKIGATTSNSIYNVLVIFQIPISAIATWITSDSKYLGHIDHSTFWPFSILLVIGICLAIYGQIYRNNRKRF